MVAVFVLLVIAIGILAGFGYSMFTFQRTAEIASLTQRNAARMETMAALVRGSAVPLVPGGPTRIPAGDLDGDLDRTILPLSIVGDDRTPWGARYGYCPLAVESVTDAGGDAGTVYGGTDYDITTRELRGTPYVNSSEGPEPLVVRGPSDSRSREQVQQDLPKGLVAIVLSPSVNSYEIPRCDEVIYRDGAFLVGLDENDDGQPESASIPGTAYPVLAATSSLAIIASDLDPTLFVSTTPAADGTGATSEDPISLAEALEYWHTARPARLTLHLEDGDYPLAGLNLAFHAGNLDNAPSSGRHLRLTDASPAGAAGARLVSASPIDLQFQVDGALDGVTLGPGVGLRVLAGADVTVEDSVLPQIRVDGGRVTVGSDSAIEQDASRAGSPVEVSSGEFTIAVRNVTSLIPKGTGFSIASTTGSAPAIRATGGNVNVEADILAPGQSLPWRTSGSAKIHFGQGLSATYASGTANMASRSLVEAAGTGDTASAMCPALQPHVMEASCSATAGALRTSEVILSTGNGPQGWSCGWASHMTAPETVSVPAGMSIRMTCSASPR